MLSVPAANMVAPLTLFQTLLRRVLVGGSLHSRLLPDPVACKAAGRQPPSNHQASVQHGSSGIQPMPSLRFKCTLTRALRSSTADATDAANSRQDDGQAALLPSARPPGANPVLPCLPG
jgi:hypothetical protein